MGKGSVQQLGRIRVVKHLHEDVYRFMRISRLILVRMEIYFRQNS
jgi:hypothetical protein